MKATRPRRALCATDLTSAAVVQHTLTGRKYTLGPPKKKNVNLNVVNHCQLLNSKGEAVSEKWWNLSNLKKAGFKLHVETGQMALRRAG